jgi:hypothetical protein
MGIGSAAGVENTRGAVAVAAKPQPFCRVLRVLGRFEGSG